VRREILRAQVRLRLDDTPNPARYTVIVDQLDADEFARNEEGVLTSVKGEGQLSSHVA
jgi:hypothetical protein